MDARDDQRARSWWRVNRGALRRRLGAVLLGCCAVLPFHPSVARSQVWGVQALLVAQDPPAEAATFGASVAVGDFDGDGHPDLAVGAPDWSGYMGSVTFFHGGGASRTLPLWDEVHGASGGEYLGWAMAAGDFDHDGKDELAVGAPGASVLYQGATVNKAGVVYVYQYQSGCGCFQVIRTLSQVDTASFFPPVYGTEFGSVLAAGRWNDDLFRDLAVGVPSQNVDGHGEAGAVQIFYGSDSGLGTADAQGFRVGADGVTGTAADQDEMGWSLAGGDFDGDGHDDLAVGTPGRYGAGWYGAGAVYILRGSSSGITTNGLQVLTPAVYGAPSEGGGFGWALAAGYFRDAPATCGGGTCYADLAIGSPFRKLNNQNTSAGAVVVAYGGASGIQISGATTLMRDVDGGTIKGGEEFGRTLAAGFVDPDPVSGLLDHSPMDLVVGAPWAGMNGATRAGYFDLVRGAAAGIGTAGLAQSVSAKPGFPIAAPEAYDQLGNALAVADFDGDGWGDVVAAATSEDVNGVNGSGAVEVLFGAMFADGFESGDTGSWSLASL